LDHVIQFVLAKCGSYDRFVKAVIAAAKRDILHGFEISTFRDWTINELYESFKSDHEKEFALRLLEKLKEEKKSR
jgi:hypothetical protein